MHTCCLIGLYFHTYTRAYRLFNYSKTLSRGVRDFQVEVDSLYLYMGSLLRADRYISMTLTL